METRRSASLVLFPALALLALAGTAASQVAIVGAPATATWNDDVNLKILGSGVNLGTTSIINAQQSTPTLAQLLAFRAVLVYSDTGFGNASVLGDNLRDYVDQGGGVVIATFTNASVPLGGAWVAQQYDAITASGQTQGTQLQLGTRHVPGHHLFTGSPVASFDGGQSSYHSIGTLAANSTRLADWTNGDIFAAERNGLAGRVLSLNFYPPSSDARSDFWLATTDGDNLLANALAYVGHFDCSTTGTYCTAKVNSLGCTPAIASQGTPSASATTGFVVNASSVRNGKSGMLLYGVSGRAGTPFAGGFRCVALAVRRTPLTSSGGSPLPANDCTGNYAIDMNAFAHGALGGHPLAALLVPGTVVDCQWWGVDPGFPAPNNTTLSAGLEYVVCQ
jgi:hypothetical protein